MKAFKGVLGRAFGFFVQICKYLGFIKIQTGLFVL